MTSGRQESDEIRERLTKAEIQLRRIKTLVVVLIGLVLILLIPPLRALLGFALLVTTLVFAVFLFIVFVIQILEWTSKTSNARRRSTQSEQ